MAVRRVVLLVCSVVALGLVGVFVAGRVALLVTDGTSMHPLYSSGDLVVVTQASQYERGDVVAYHDPDHDLVALHRIVGGHEDGFVLRGDNNDSVDPYEPAAQALLGRAVAHVPQGGRWLDRLTHPTALAAYAFALAISGGTAAQTRRNRRRRTMSQHAIERRTTVSVTTLPPALRTAAGVTAGAGVLAAALGAFGWSGPLEEPGRASETTVDRAMTFSYSADVPLTPAYDGTTVESPDPVFRKLTDTVDVHYAYEGDPGAVSVAAELSSASGWRSTVPLADPVRFETREYDGQVRLDLAALEARAQAAAEVTGLPADQLTVSVVPTVTTSDGESFSPALTLALTPLTLALTGDAATLTTQEPGGTEARTMQPRTLDVLGLGITAELARLLSGALAALVVLASVTLLAVARSVAPTSEGGQIRRRYASLLVPVQPMPTPPARPVVDVTEFATLAKLAERYGLLVLHWARSGVETFVVQDEGTTYRYRSGVGADAVEVRTSEAATEPAPSV